MLAAAAVAYQVETLSDALWDELQPLLGAHYHEIAHYGDIPLDPDRAGYQRIQNNGALRLYTARTADGHLVGYLAVFIARSLHYRSVIFANQDVLYVERGYRGSRVGVDLIRFAHAALKAEGVTALYQHVKHRSDLNIGPMLKRLLGYEQVDDILAIRLDRLP